MDALAHGRQSWWQILPLGPTGYGDSPYQAFSAFAGNPYLISPIFLMHDELLDQEDFAGVHFPAERVDYGAVMDVMDMLRKAGIEDIGLITERKKAAGGTAGGQ